MAVNSMRGQCMPKATRRGGMIQAYFFLAAAASMVPSWMDLAVADLNIDGGVSTVSKRCSRSFMQTG